MNPRTQFMSTVSGNTQTSTPAYSSKPKKSFLQDIMDRGRYNPNPSKVPEAGKPMPTSASPAATGMQPATPAPATRAPSSLSSPAAQGYIGSLGGGAAQKSQLDSIRESALGIQKSLQAGITPDKPEKPAESEYLKYMRSIFNPKEADIAQQNVNELNKRTADEIARARDKEDELRKNELGRLEGSQTNRLNVEARESNKSLADLAIAKGYATDILKQYTDAGKTIEEAEQAANAEANKMLSYEEAQSLGVPIGTTWGQARQKGLIPPGVQAEGFSLSEGQARYDAQGNMIASRGKTYAPGTGGGGGTYVAGANPAVDSWVQLINAKRASITNVPAALKTAVASALASGANNYTPSETSFEAMTLIDELLARDLDPILGGVQQFTGGLYGPNAYTADKFNTLKGLLSLEKRTLLKGSGAISDYEFKVLEQAASSLTRKLDTADFVAELTKLKERLQSGPNGGVNAIAGGGGGGEAYILDGVTYVQNADGSYDPI